MLEYFRSLIALIVPELLEPANVVMVGVVGMAGCNRTRVMVASSLILGGAFLCVLIFTAVSVIGQVASPVTINRIGSSVIALVGLCSLIDACRDSLLSAITSSSFRDSVVSHLRANRICQWLAARNLVVQAFILGLCIEMAQSSALLAFGMAASSDNQILTLLGAVTAHIGSKSALLGISLSVGMLLWSTARAATHYLLKLHPELGNRLWFACIKTRVKYKTFRIDPDSQHGKLSIVARCLLGLALIAFAIQLNL